MTSKIPWWKDADRFSIGGAVTLDRLLEIGNNLRPADRKEIRDSGFPPLFDHVALFASVNSSVEVDFIHYGTKRVAIVGHGPSLTDPQVGIIWAMGTEGPYLKSHHLWKFAKTIVRGIARQYPGGLVNKVHVDNIVHIRWLERLGFTVRPAAPGAKFRIFTYVYRD